MARHQLTDQQWECIESFFKQRAKTGRPPADPRGVMDAILWIVRTGAPCAICRKSLALGRPCITISTSGVPRAS